VLLVHEMVPKARASIGDAAIGQLQVERAEGRWYAFDEESVEEADGSVPETVSPGLNRVRNWHTERPANVRKKL
jgi:hypothetical protein